MTPQHNRVERHLLNTLQHWQAIKMAMQGHAGYAEVQVDKFERMLKELRAGEMAEEEVESILLWYAVPSRLTEQALKVCQQLVEIMQSWSEDVELVPELEPVYNAAKAVLKEADEQYPAEPEARSESHDTPMLLVWGGQERDPAAGGEGRSPGEGVGIQ